jgi:hypothetical protein
MQNASGTAKEIQNMMERQNRVPGMIPRLRENVKQGCGTVPERSGMANF